jgi:RNA-directed DNA polymerase
MDFDHQADEAWLLNIQRKLYSWSRGNPDEAWGDLWNWCTSPQNLRLAWRRVSSNRGARTAGVDGVTVKQIQGSGSVNECLAEIREKLRSGAFSPSPVRRVLIPKLGKRNLST